jgi:hypothetical protein
LLVLIFGFTFLVAAEKAFEPKVRQFRRTQALAILLAFVNNRQLHQLYPSQKLVIFRKTLVNLLGELADKRAARAKPRHLLSLFTILRGLKQQDAGSSADLDWPEVRQQLAHFAQSFAINKQTGPVKKSFKKLLAFLDVKVTSPSSVVPATTADQPAVSTESGAVESKAEKKKTKKKKKNKNKEALQRKKEKKLEAAAAQTDQGVPSFADFLVDNTEVFVPVKEEKFKPNKNKKRKLSEKSPGSPRLKQNKS